MQQRVLLRIAIVTQDEPFYLPEFLMRIVGARARDIVAIIVLTPFNESIVQVARRAYNLFGPWDFLLHGIRFAVAKAMNLVSMLIPVGGPWSAGDVARRANVPLYRPGNVNSPQFLSVLGEKIRPDVIVSVAASQVFRQKLLSLPTRGCINIHTGPLPRYRGMLPSFWALHNGEDETAVTVHYMNAALDDGDIIRQETVPISPDETLDSLVKKTKRIGAGLLLDALQDIEKGVVERRDNDASQATYFSFPTKEDSRRFRAVGRRFR